MDGASVLLELDVQEGVAFLWLPFEHRKEGAPSKQAHPNLQVEEQVAGSDLLRPQRLQREAEMENGLLRMSCFRESSY